jgi:hypothetical protein
MTNCTSDLMLPDSGNSDGSRYPNSASSMSAASGSSCDMPWLWVTIVVLIRRCTPVRSVCKRTPGTLA